MTDTKMYLQPKSNVIAGIQYMKRMQIGKETFSDIQNGIIHFTVWVKDEEWEYRIAVTEVEQNQCEVKIGIGGDVMNKDEKIRSEFAMLDSMLP